jgi:hypothetical protein
MICAPDLVVSGGDLLNMLTQLADEADMLVEVTNCVLCRSV